MADRQYFCSAPICKYVQYVPMDLYSYIFTKLRKVNHNIGHYISTAVHHKEGRFSRMSWCLMYFKTFSIVGLSFGVLAQHALIAFQCVFVMKPSVGRLGLLPL